MVLTFLPFKNDKIKTIPNDTCISELLVSVYVDWDLSRSRDRRQIWKQRWDHCYLF